MAPPSHAVLSPAGWVWEPGSTELGWPGGWIPAAAVTDTEALQASAPVPVAPEAHHDAGGGNRAGHGGMAAEEQL